MHIRRLTFTPCIGTVAQHLVYALCGSHASFQTHLKAHGSSRKRHRYHRRDFPDTLTNGGAEIGATPQRGTEGAGATAPPPVFTVVPTAHINMRMESQVESYLRGQEKQREAESQHRVSMTVPKINVINVPRSPLKRAVLDFDVRGQQVRAVGQSKRVKVARALCCMHAVQLIDHFSVDAAGRDDAPPPLEEEVISAGPYGLPSMHSSKHLRRPSTPSYPTWEPGAPWENYVGACEKYIRHQQQQQRAEAYAQLRIPPSGNPLVDRAADLTQQQRQCDNLALQKLNNEILHATKDMQVVRISRRIFAATLLLDGASHLCATGVASTLREAKQRCAMHALSILKLVREQRLQSGAADDAALPSNTSSHGGVSLSLSPRYAKLLDFFTLLCDVRPKPSFTKEGKKYTCELRLDGTTCKGSGINRFEAERNAVEGALSEMELYDERLQAINSIISRYPKIVPQCVPTVKLPKDLREGIHSLVRRVCGDNRGMADGTLLGIDGGLAVTSGGSHSDVTNGVNSAVDPTTRTIIDVLGTTLRDEAYANQMRERLCALRADSKYMEWYHNQRKSLSINAVSESILNGLQRSRVLVVCGSTGCGKTTQVPQYILDAEIMAGRGDECNIVVTQPRRLSAFSVAERIANERLSTVGGDVGYAVRLEARPGRHITLCTTGVLLQMLIGMPTLNKVSHLIIDEVHERDINCDVLLALVKDLLESGKNPRLKVILMSATMQSATFASYFGQAPVIKVEGAVYPVEVRYLEDVAALLQKDEGHCQPYYSSMFDCLTATSSGIVSNTGGSRGRAGFHGKKWFLTSPQKTDYRLIAELIDRSVTVDLRNDVVGKSILVFLPGWKELVAAKQTIESLRSQWRYHIILLHSAVDAAKQRECFDQAPDGKVKVVLATNIAESGITIDDAAVVIDTGLIKQTTWTSRTAGVQNYQDKTSNQLLSSSSSAASYATQLALQYASQANCTQRKGRAGRTQRGVCYRLFTRGTWDALPAFQQAEIHRVPLSQVLLKLLALGHEKPKEKLRTFIEPPAEKNVENSFRQLQSLGAVTADERLTPLGLYLSHLPCEPTIAKMIMMGAVLRCLDSTLTMAATGDISPFISSREVSLEVRQRRHALAMGSQSDHVSVLNAYNAFCARRGDFNFARENFLNMSNMKLISRYKQQYRDILQRSGFIRNTELRSLDFSDDCGKLSGESSRSLYVDGGPLSSDASDVALVKACLCAALFPNVAVLDPTPLLQQQRTTAKTLVMRTPTRTAISPSKDSACRKAGPPRAHGIATSQEIFQDEPTREAPSMFYIYQSIFALKESREEFLTQVSSVSLWALLLFGVGEADMSYDGVVPLCVVGDWIGINIDQESYEALLKLRTILHMCVWRKYKHPENSQNNQTLEELRHICKKILKSPPNDREQHINRLVDTGCILSPCETQDLPNNTREVVDDDGSDGNFAESGCAEAWETS